MHISIHALREEGDPQLERGKLPVTNYFYPRPPRGGRRSACRRKLRCCPISIHALREEGDCRHARDHAVQLNFYPRPPRGGRPVVVLQHVGFHQFLSTPSARRATLKTTITTNVGGISIHALREEGDRRAFLQGRLPVYFYPRPPRGGRPVMQDGLTRYVKFLSTPSARRATPRGKQATESTAISIHALREEGDVMQSFTKKYCFQFLSTPSARRATFKPEQSSVLQGLFLSTPSARRATRSKCAAKPFQTNFYPRPPRGGRPHHHKTGGQKPYFYPRPPRGGRLLNEV